MVIINKNIVSSNENQMFWNYDYYAAEICQERQQYLVHIFFPGSLSLSHALNLFMRIKGDYHFDCRIKMRHFYMMCFRSLC